MLRFDKTKKAEEFYDAKKLAKIWDGYVDNKVTPKLTKTKNDCKNLIEYLDEAIKPLVLILLKLSEYVKIFKDKGNKLMPFLHRWW